MVIQLSSHFRHSLKALAAVATLLLGGFLWLRHRIHDVITPSHVTLPKNDKEIVSFDENRHIVMVTTAKGTMRKYSRSPDVEIRKDGTVKVDANAWGTELRPFLGIGYSDTGRAYAGCQLLYFHQFDAGASFGWTSDANKPAFQPMLSVGWNFYSNSSLNVGLNPVPYVLQRKPELAVFLSIRL